MRKIKNFNNYMKENKNISNKETNSIMLCPECDSSGYVKDKEGKSSTCKRCKGKGILRFKKNQNSE